MNYSILSQQYYDAPLKAGSIIGGLVEIIGEQKVLFSDGSIVEQYIYNIVNYTPVNNKPFVALKSNLFLY